MDTKNDCKIPNCGSLRKMTNLRMVVGSKQLRKALDNGSAKFVYLAQNADPAITEASQARRGVNHVSYTWVGNMQ